MKTSTQRVTIGAIAIENDGMGKITYTQGPVCCVESSNTHALMRHSFSQRLLKVSKLQLEPTCSPAIMALFQLSLHRLRNPSIFLCLLVLIVSLIIVDL